MLKEHISKGRHISYNLFTAKLDTPKPASEYARTIVDRRSSGIRRVRAGIHLSSRVLEKLGVDLEDKVHNLLYKAIDLPFERSEGASEPELIGYGSENFVFKLDTNPPRVLKVDNRTIKLSTEEKTAKAKRLQVEHQKIKELFSDIDDFVLPSVFLISRLPYRGKEALGIIQPYVDNPRGLFEDFSEEELVGILRNDSNFRDNLIAVSDKVNEIYAQNRTGIDLGGTRNISVSQEAGSHRLVLIDSCDIMDFTVQDTPRQRAAQSRFEARLNVLSYFADKAKEIRDVGPVHL